MTFADIGDIFNDATNRLVGGISEQNQQRILKDLTQVQDGLEKLLATQPEQFEGVAGIHAQNVIDQLNLEIDAVKAVGTNPFAAKYINDVQRDLIDIVQGDEQLVALATQGGKNGFAAVPDLLVGPAQFQGNAEQTEFMKTFITTTQDFADRAVALAEAPGDAQAVQQLIGEVHAYTTAANAFTLAQGGLYSARFDNEFAANGVSGTASRALIDGLATGNADKVNAAAEVLVANANDVASNMLGIGDDPPDPTGNGIPETITSVAQAGIVFNDATAKLIGGVYDGNRQSIHDDLAATQQGLTDLVTDGALTGAAARHATRAADLIGKELVLVDNADAGGNAAAQIHKLHAKVINIVQNDATLAAAATEDGATGFMQLPDANGGRGAGGGNGGCRAGGSDSGNGHGGDHLAQIFQVDGFLQHG